MTESHTHADGRGLYRLKVGKAERRRQQRPRTDHGGAIGDESGPENNPPPRTTRWWTNTRTLWLGVNE